MALLMLRLLASFDSTVLTVSYTVFGRAPAKSRLGGRLSMLSCALLVGGNDLYFPVIRLAGHIVVTAVTKIGCSSLL